MVFTTLISQFDNHNEVTLLLAHKFKVKELVLIVSKEFINDREKVKNRCDKLFLECSVKLEFVEIGDFEGLKNSISKYSSCIINLNGGKVINSLMLLRASSELRKQSIYVDLQNKRRYIFTDSFRVINQQLEDISIENVIQLSGAKIIDESSYLCKKEEIINISKYILKNMEIWHKYKQKLYDNNIFIHNYKDPTKVCINKGLLGDEEDLVRRCVKFLKSINEIDVNENNETIEVLFKNNYLKGFLFKSGTWLEVITHTIIEDIKSIDEIKSGVMFSWSENAKEVRNEIDVVAIRDSVLICISCKDSDKYDEDALNELQVYSEKLGGEDTIKILVATKKPSKITVMNRAKEMGIHLILIDKDINKFKEEIDNIIKIGNSK